MRIKILLIILGLLGIAACNHDTRHYARIMKLRNHHIVMWDDKGHWYEYVLNNSEINFDIPVTATGELQLPRGGVWVALKASPEDEEEITAEEDTTVDESPAGEPDGSGDVGGDSGGDGGGDGGGSSD
jgi:hypothetical protein